MAEDKNTSDRLPPQNLDAERSVLGSLLRDNKRIDDVVPILHVDHFYADAHRKIYDAIRHLYDNTQRVDTVLLAEELMRRGHIEDIGGYGYLAELWDSAPIAANAEYYAKIVHEKALLRRLIHSTTEILRDAYDQALPIKELVEIAERKILDVSDLGATGEAVTLADALAKAYDRIDDRNRGETMSMSGLATGFTDLDELASGLQNGGADDHRGAAVRRQNRVRDGLDPEHRRGRRPPCFLRQPRTIADGTRGALPLFAVAG